MKQKLNYQIKYEHLDSLKQPVPYYLVDGKWVTRGLVPEVRAGKKKWRALPGVAEKENKKSRDRYWADPKKDNLRTSTWKRNNKEKVREAGKRYLNSENGYFKEMWNGIKKSKQGHDFKDFDDFFQCWLDQKAIHGMICPATGVTMTMIRRMTGHSGCKRTQTNISRDRILCSRGYSKQNLIFTTWKYNNSKNNMSPKLAKAFLRIVRERYGTDEVE